MTRQELEAMLDGRQIQPDDKLVIVLDLGEDVEENIPTPSHGDLCRITDIDYDQDGPVITWRLNVRPQ